MRFTEREMTVGIDLVAQQLHAATLGPFRRRDAAAAWEALDAFGKYQRRAAIGEAVLPALLALPERPTVGATPSFTDAEYDDAAASAARSLLDHRSPGAWDGLPERKRSKIVSANAALVRSVVAAMPVRQDPDALIVPDTLEGLD